MTGGHTDEEAGKKFLSFVLTLAMVFSAFSVLPGMTQKAHASQYPSETIATNTGAHSYAGDHFTIDNGNEIANSYGIAGKKAPITIAAKNNEVIKNVIITSGLGSDFPASLINANPSTSVTSKGRTITIEGVDSTSFTLICNFEGAYFNNFVIQYEEAPVTVKVDVGAGHEGLITDNLLTKLKNGAGAESASAEGSVITLTGVNPNNKTEGGFANSVIWFYVNNSIPSMPGVGRIDNGEKYLDIGYKPIDEYESNKAFVDDQSEHYSIPLSDSSTFYVLWQKPYEKLELGNANPTCGKQMWEAFPTVPDGFTLNPEDSRWVDENDERVETFEGGKEYTLWKPPFQHPQRQEADRPRL